MPKRHSLYIISITCITAIILLLLVFAYILMSNIFKNSRKIISEKEEIQNMQAQDKAIADFKAKYNDYQGNLQKIDSAFIDSSDPISFITFLEGISSKTNIVSHVDIASVPQTDAAGVRQPMAFTVSASGDFANIIRFSEELEMGPYLVNVSAVTIKKADGFAASLTTEAGKTSPPPGLGAYFVVQAVPK